MKFEIESRQRRLNARHVALPNLENTRSLEETHSVSYVNKVNMESIVREYLRVKIKSLSSEAKIIRHEERKVMKWKREPDHDPEPIYFGLHRHRTQNVRRESRSAHLAYGFLREMPYRKIEDKCYTKPNWSRVKDLASKYGDYTHNEVKFLDDKIKAWSELK